MSNFQTMVSKLSEAIVAKVMPTRFEVIIRCRNIEEANSLSSYVSDGQVGDMEIVSVDEDGVLLEVEAISDQEARERITQLIHKSGLQESVLSEVAAPGFSGTAKKMKLHHGKEIDNPWALSWWMWKKGAKPHVKPDKQAKGRKTYVSPKKYKSKSESVQETTTTDAIETIPLPWVSPPLSGIPFDKEEKDEILGHIKTLFPNMSAAELKKSIFGDKKKD